MLFYSKSFIVHSHSKVTDNAKSFNSPISSVTLALILFLPIFNARRKMKVRSKYRKYLSLIIIYLQERFSLYRIFFTLNERVGTLSQKTLINKCRELAFISLVQMQSALWGDCEYCFFFHLLRTCYAIGNKHR